MLARDRPTSPAPPRVPFIRGLACAALALGIVACTESRMPPPTSAVRAITQWPAYGGDPGGQRYAAALGITRENVSRLAVAWTHRTGDLSDGRGAIPSTTAYENTPILVGDLLYACSPFNKVFALDPVSGEERWSFDPEIDLSGRYANQLICRGVAVLEDAARDSIAPCARTIFTATNDARLLALDGRTGERCDVFGKRGEVDLNPGVGEQLWKGEYQVTSPPVVIGGLVVVGSAVSDNQRIDAPSGVIRAYDARTGVQRWSWDLAPPGFDYTTGLVSEEGFALGTPNVWGPMSSDPERDLLFVPTGNAAPDYYHGTRSEMNHYGSSVVALRGRTGEIVWHFQTVHDDLWDYDVPAQPTLTTLEVEGISRPALVQTTKMGLLFVLDRETGEPLFPVVETNVPPRGAPGETISPTQPIPQKPPMLIRNRLSPDDAWGLTFWDRGKCRDKLASLRNDGMYTPPSLRGSLMYPGNAGGSNWGGIAVEPARKIAIVRNSDLPWAVKLIERDQLAAYRAQRPGREIGPQTGARYGMHREMLVSPLGLPCNPPPWGTLSAIDLNAGEILWQVPHGSVRDLAPLPLPVDLGIPGLGGPIVTAGGLVFIAAALDDYLRAYDVETGEELVKLRLPAGGQATPMSYRVTFADGSARQYVVIAAGGHARGGSRLGDSLVAFALEE